MSATRYSMLAFLTISIAMTSSVGAGENVHRWDLLRGYDPNPDEFKEYEIGNKIVYWHQRKIGEAIIEKEHIAYHFDKKSRKLTDIKVKWRDELPATLPRLALTKKQAESMVRGKVSYSQLWVISPDSVVFPIKPAPKNPCWVVTSIDANDGMQKTVIDAVEGKIVGYGIVPPYAGFAMSGQSSCGPSWLEWSENARNWFETMGYPTEKIDYPQLSKRDIIEQVRSSDIAMFYEVAHGGESSIDPTCIPVGRVNRIFAYDVAEWIQECSVMPFTFLASCDGMCFTGQGTFAYEFTKGYADNTAAVGYCGMSTESCSGECWSDSIDWQSALFGYMSEGYTVKDAFDLANADFPDCYNNQCMRFAGDPDFSAVPVIARDRAQNLTRGGVYASIQDAIDNAQNYDVIRVFRGHHRENIVINGKVLSIQSVDANDREVVSETIIEGDSALPVVTFSNVSTGQGLVLRGFTIRGGSCGVECTAGASVEISKCIISNNEGAGINCTGTGQAILANNIIYDNAAGITLSQSQARATMRNNTITDNTSLGISYSGNPQFSPFISNCILWNNNNDIEGCQASYSCIGEANAIGEPGITHNVCTDPLFIDTAGHNYRLKITSPCIDRGDTTLADANETDIDGDPRVRNPRLDGNAVVDIGADEVWKWVLNVTRQTYYPGIAEAISDAQDADRIMLGPGVHKSPEKNIADAGITLMSMDPDNWEVVENTVVDGFIGIESSSTLSGLRITATHGSCGVYLLGNYNFKINRCIIEDFYNGIYYCSGGTATITGNKFRRSQELSYGIGIYTDSPGQLLIKDNWIYDAIGAIRVGNSRSQVIISNNTITKCQNFGINVESCPVAPAVSNCIVWNEGSADDLVGCSATYSCIYDAEDSGEGVIHDNPQFVNPDGNDFHIGPDSPCLNAGNPQGSYAGESDIDSEPRFNGTPIDVGADEVPMVHNVTGDTWFTSIQNAIDGASNGDELVASLGAYHENVIFTGKNINLRSFNNDNTSAVISATGSTDVVTFNAGAEVNLSGFTLTGGNYGIYSAGGSSPVISNCIIRDNNVGVYAGSSTISVGNNIIRDNDAGIKFENAQGTVVNNTIVNNTSFGVQVTGDGVPAISNCILWNNGDDLSGCSASYCCIEDNDAGEGNIHLDPFFVSGPEGNYYLSQSAAGQAADSPCVNAGSNTAVNLGMNLKTTRTDEIRDTNIVDMGYHYNGGIVVINPDLSGDAFIDFIDYALFADDWQQPSDPCEPNNGDITKDDLVDIYDLVQIVERWLTCIITQATGPEPTDYETEVSRFVTLKWKAGEYCSSHDIFFGTDFDEVSNADITNTDVYMGNIDSNTWDTGNYAPTGLKGQTTYYWRIDETAAGCNVKGDVWSFTTMAASSELAARWSFDEGTGTVASDSSGYGNNGDIIGATWVQNPQRGWCLYFDRDGDYVTIPDSDTLQFETNEMTISAWIMPEENFQTYMNTIICKEEDYYLGWGLTILDGGIYGYASDLVAAYNAFGSPPYFYMSNPEINPGEWYHIVITDQLEDKRIYINGQLDFLSYGFGIPQGINAPILIGSSFKGLIDDVRLYNGVLSAQEVQDLYQSGR